MKRAAEKQLSKDDQSDGEAQHDASQVGFQKADQSVLATRQIRALPKRSSVAALLTTETSLSNFSGFHGSSSSFQGFDTGVPTAEAAPTPVQTNTAKSLSSLLSSNSTDKSTNSTSTCGSSSPLAASSTTSLTTSSPPASTKKDAEVDYFKNLRGLNESLRSAINEFIDAHPFVDLREVFDQYRDYRVKIQEDFDNKVSPPSLSSTATPAPSVSVENKLSTQVPPSGGLSSDEVKAPTSTDIKPLATFSNGPASDTQSKANKSDGSSSSLPFSPVSDPVNTTSSRPVATTSAFSGFGTKQFEPSKGFTPASQTPALSVFGTKQTETFKDSTPAFPGFGTKQTETSKDSSSVSTASAFPGFGTKQHETPKGFTPVSPTPALSVFGTKQHETSKDSSPASKTSIFSSFGTQQNETFKGSTLASTSTFSGFGTKQNETFKGFTPASATTTFSNFGTKQHETSKGFTPAAQAPALSVFGTKHYETSKDSSPASKTSTFSSFGTVPKQYETKGLTSAATTSAFSGFGTKQHETSKDSRPASSTPNLPPKATDSKISPSVLTGSTKPETKPTSASSPRPFGSGFSSSFSVIAPTQPEGSSVPASGSRFGGFTGFSSFSQSAASMGFKPSSMTPITSFSPNFARTPSTLTTIASDSSTNGDITGTGTAVKPSDANAEAFQTTTAESFIIDAENKHDREGAGEEDEETVYSAKLKAYVMKDGETGKSWVELGYGVLRVKKHKESQAKRVLLRSSSTGQVLINFNFHSAFKPVQKGKNVTFLGHDAERTPKMFTVKLQTQERAVEFAAILNREIQGRNAPTSS